MFQEATLVQMVAALLDPVEAGDYELQGTNENKSMLLVIVSTALADGPE